MNFAQKNISVTSVVELLGHCFRNTKVSGSISRSPIGTYFTSCKGEKKKWVLVFKGKNLVSTADRKFSVN